MVNEYTPTTGALLEIYRGYRRRNRGLIGSAPPHRQIEAEFDRFIAVVRAAARREGQAEGMRSTADWLDGGTPRAYGFQHPCDPPHMRTQPTEGELRLMYAVDAIREAADRIENGADQ